MSVPVMTPWIAVLLWWAAFAGTHMLLSSRPVRGALIGRLGEQLFQGVYSLVAFATFIPLVWTYWHHRHSGALLWSLRGNPAVHAIAFGLAGLAWIIIVLSIVQPSPTGLAPGAAARARGITRITRHPLFAGLGLWGFAHLLVNGTVTDVVFFGGFVVYTLIGAAHQDARKRTTDGPALSPFYAETSTIPFAAIASGRTYLAIAELPVLGLVVGAALAAALYAAHGWLFG